MRHMYDLCPAKYKENTSLGVTAWVSLHVLFESSRETKPVSDERLPISAHSPML